MKEGEEHGSCIREPFCSDAVYRLAATEGDRVETVDQAELLLEVTFVDGTVKEERYTLHAEKLRAFFNEDGGEVLVPALKGDRDGNIPALYLEGKDARWLVWPVADSQTVSLSMSYGFQKRINADNSAFHTGIDIPGAGGMKIAAAEAGCVVETGYDSRQGNYLVIDHGDGLTTRYAHCQEVMTAQGAVVEKGQAIALMGSTGMSTGPHLHFEVRQDGAAQNPVAYFTGEIRDTLHAQ
ncbi:MAG: M23 family metallopeptidase [Ruminococcaceae bacterium]|nr:M23 family metallopeptidase [Oscillospiraceae bacterium]